MRAATLFCVLAIAQAWIMPKSSAWKSSAQEVMEDMYALKSLLSSSAKPDPKMKKCTIPQDYVRLATQINDTKWKGSQRLPTKAEMSDPQYLAEPYLHTIYYINLDKSTDRSAHMLSQLNTTAHKYHAERLPAMNRTAAWPVKRNPRAWTANLEHVQGGPGTIATYLSHRTALDKIAAHPDNNAVFVVLEDDALLVNGWADEIMCQIKLLPADWDVYKFGYWPLPTAHWALDHSCSGGIRQKAYNEYTCNQRSFALEWMGNVGYAMRPKGARTALEHLKQVPIMDVDGAMMPGCCIRNSTNVAQNFYVSRYTLARHGKFHTTRLKDKMAASTTADLQDLDDKTEDGRETSYQARVRLSEAAKRGELVGYSPQDDEESDDDKDKVTALAGLGA